MKKIVQTLLAMTLLTACSLRPANMSAPTNGTVAMRSFLEMTESLSVATGIPTNNNAVRNFFNGARQRMSLDGNAESVSPSLLLAGTALAGVYCMEFITKEAGLTSGERLVHQAVNFNQGPSALDAATRRALITSYARIFWQRDPVETEISILLTAMQEAETGVTNNGTELRNILRVACAAAGSSLDSVRN